jgi:hypothetical protein
MKMKTPTATGIWRPDIFEAAIEQRTRFPATTLTTTSTTTTTTATATTTTTTQPAFLFTDFNLPAINVNRRQSVLTASDVEYRVVPLESPPPSMPEPLQTSSRIEVSEQRPNQG